MKDRCRVLATVALGLLLVGVTAGRASAQERLPNEIIASEAITAQQQQAIDGFIGGAVQRLVVGNDAEVVEARSTLLSPFTPAATDAFINAYAAALAPALMPATQANRVIVRLNAQVIAGRLDTAAVTPVIVTGLGDDNAGVRYRASKAVRRLADQGVLNDAARQQLLDALRDAAGNEAQLPVVEQELMAMVELETPQAITSVIEALGSRLTLHAGEPRQGYNAEYGAMQALLRKLIEAGAQPQQVRDFGRIALQYLRLIVQQARGGALPGPAMEQRQLTVELTENVLRFVRETLGSTQPLPQEIGRQFAAGNWDFVTQQADAWAAVLTAAPINLDAASLQPPPAP